jgi:hypothetical protein
MRQSRLSGSVEGVMGNHDSYSDSICAASPMLGDRRAMVPSHARHDHRERLKLIWSFSVVADMREFLAQPKYQL